MALPEDEAKQTPESGEETFENEALKQEARTRGPGTRGAGTRGV